MEVALCGVEDAIESAEPGDLTPSANDPRICYYICKCCDIHGWPDCCARCAQCDSGGGL
ncbi:MAG: hypothetical protein KC933_19470 [Myxococcales bacterium]|nr:hypothetical protein [Myxococcales bacterium]MCB9646447.1 hypothetical protein [Deltaproteobacteria bacterium]